MSAADEETPRFPQGNPPVSVEKLTSFRLETDQFPNSWMIVHSLSNKLFIQFMKLHPSMSIHHVIVAPQPCKKASVGL
jgi:hypothetical protein